MEEIHQSIWKAFRDRITSPVTGVFAILWLVFNWRAVMFVLLDDRPILVRTEIAIMLFSGWWTLFWGPAVVTFLYVVIHPFLLVGAYAIADFGDVLQRRIGYRYENKKPFSGEERAKLITDYRTLQGERDAYYGQLLEQRTQYESVITQLQDRQVKLENALHAAPEDNVDANRSIRDELAALKEELNDARNRMENVSRQTSNDEPVLPSTVGGLLRPKPTVGGLLRPKPTGGGMLRSTPGLSDFGGLLGAVAVGSRFSSESIDKKYHELLRWLAEDFPHPGLFGHDPAKLQEALALNLIEERKSGYELSEFGKVVLALYSNMK